MGERKRTWISYSTISSFYGISLIANSSKVPSLIHYDTFDLSTPGAWNGAWNYHRFYVSNDGSYASVRANVSHTKRPAL